MLIKVSGKQSIGKTRSEQARNLQKEGWGTAGLTPEQLDKCRYLDKKGSKKWFNQRSIDGVK